MHTTRGQLITIIWSEEQRTSHGTKNVFFSFKIIIRDLPGNILKFKNISGGGRGMVFLVDFLLATSLIQINEVRNFQVFFNKQLSTHLKSPSNTNML